LTFRLLPRSKEFQAKLLAGGVLEKIWDLEGDLLEALSLF
jgi:hypothetical protein